MPKTKVILYCQQDGSAPFLEWFAEISARAQDKCRVRIERLGELGHELRRPESDYLRDGIYELRPIYRVYIIGCYTFSPGPRQL